MTLDDVLEARSRNWVGVSEVEFADHLTWLIDRVGKLERAHEWFVENTADSGCACDDKDDCEWVKAKELRR